MIRLGLSMVALMLVCATALPWLYPPAPTTVGDLPRLLESPWRSPPLGRDEFGGDVWARWSSGARLSLLISLSVVALSLTLGAAAGALAGWREGWLDQLVIRLSDTAQAFPAFIVAMALLSVRGPGVENVILALSLTGWASYARLTRAEVMRLKNLPFVQAATALGSEDRRLLMSHIAPHILPLLAVQAAFHAGGTIVAETGLSFLGLSIEASESSWGGLLASGRQHLHDGPHLAWAACLAIVYLVLALNLLGEGLRRRWNPR